MNLVSARTGPVSLRLGIILSLAGVPSLEASPITYRVLDLGTLSFARTASDVCAR
jgi:hypothetical protein